MGMFDTIHVKKPLVCPACGAEESERHRAFRRLFSLPDEILTAPDPLAAILAANKQVSDDVED